MPSSQQPHVLDKSVKTQTRTSGAFGLLPTVPALAGRVTKRPDTAEWSQMKPDPMSWKHPESMSSISTSAESDVAVATPLGKPIHRLDLHQKDAVPGPCQHAATEVKHVQLSKRVVTQRGCAELNLTSNLVTEASQVPDATAAVKETKPDLPSSRETLQAGIESQVQSDPLFTPELKMKRRAELGLDSGTLAAFVDSCEFVSLGCFCAVSTALESLGLRRHAYPFDWVRCPVDGVIHCLEVGFEDFLTFSNSRSEGEHQVFSAARWGGSFWHHDPEAAGTRDDFIRRIDRFLGCGEVHGSVHRIFVRAVNSTQELRATPQLQESLERVLPNAQVRLLVLIDLQDVQGPIEVAGFRGKVLFYRISGAVWEGGVSKDGRDYMQWSSEAYTEAIAYAARYWSTDETPPLAATVQSMPDLEAAVVHFDGGAAANEPFWPRRFRGQPISLRHRQLHEVADLAPLREQRFPGLLQIRRDENVEVRLPEGIKPGDFLQTIAFGRVVKTQVPAGACSGKMLQLRYAQGVITSKLGAAAPETERAGSGNKAGSLDESCASTAASSDASPSHTSSASTHT